MAINRTKSERAEYTVTYSDMRGVDFSKRSAGGKRYRFSHLENMYKDYSKGIEGVIESIPGFRKIAGFGEKIHSIFAQKDNTGRQFILVHAGKSLYRFENDKRDSIGSSPFAIASLRDSESSAFVYGSRVYVLDGERITVVDGEGGVTQVSSSDDSAAYIPTTFVNGEEYEQRNLLTDKFTEKYFIASAHDEVAETSGLEYRVLSEEEKTAAVTGIIDSASGYVFVPAYKLLGTQKYKITEVADDAFRGNASITAIILPDTLKRIGKCAFLSCRSLGEVVTRSSIELIDSNAFLDCGELYSVYLGRSLKKIGVGAFNSCTELKSLNYGGTEEEFCEISMHADLGEIEIIYESISDSVFVEIPIFSPASSINSVTIDGDERIFMTKIKDSLIESITVVAAKSGQLNGREVVIRGVASPSNFTRNTIGTDFISETGGTICGRDAILGCRICESFDGRIFISGNPALPNTVFYSQRDLSGRNNPLYFGILNYFNDGIGGFEVGSLLSIADTLAVFKKGDDGGGSVYYHTAKETGVNILPKIYPVSYIHSGISSLGKTISFYDDPLFLSDIGCVALAKKAINLQRSIACRSGNVNSRLLSEDLGKASLTVWQGYLVIMTEGHAYLADSRATFTGEGGNAEYEWYFLSGIGTYSRASRVFRYAETSDIGYEIRRDRLNEIAEGNIYVDMVNGVTHYYLKDGDTKYAVYTLGEKVGGDFSPATVVLSTEDELLYFGTESGDLCVFNTDKIGEAPPYISNKSGYEDAEYKSAHKDKLHPYYYLFDGHAPGYYLKTADDDCNTPYMTKSTVKHSLVVKLYAYGTGSVVCEVGTNEKGYKEIAKLPATSIDFDEFAFDLLSFTNEELCTIPIKEKEKRWIQKSIALYTKDFLSPFGLSLISYRFNVKGKIKN